MGGERKVDEEVGDNTEASRKDDTCTLAGDEWYSIERLVGNVPTP